MYRLQVADQSGQSLGWYQNVDTLSESQFVFIATGGHPPTQPQDNWPPAGTTYTAVWDPEHLMWLDNITAEEAVQHYPHCSRTTFP